LNLIVGAVILFIFLQCFCCWVELDLVKFDLDVATIYTSLQWKAMEKYTMDFLLTASIMMQEPHNRARRIMPQSRVHKIPGNYRKKAIAESDTDISVELGAFIGIPILLISNWCE